jgi:hypothetical protein
MSKSNKKIRFYSPHMGEKCIIGLIPPPDSSFIIPVLEINPKEVIAKVLKNYSLCKGELKNER